MHGIKDLSSDSHITHHIYRIAFRFRDLEVLISCISIMPLLFSVLSDSLLFISFQLLLRSLSSGAPRPLSGSSGGAHGVWTGPIRCCVNVEGIFTHCSLPIRCSLMTMT